MKLLLIAFIGVIFNPIAAQPNIVDETENNETQKILNNIEELQKRIELLTNQTEILQKNYVTVNQKVMDLQQHSLITDELKNTNNELQNIKSEIRDTNFTNLVVIAVSIAIAVIGLGAAISQAIISRKMLSTQKAEFIARVRPVVTRASINVLPTYTPDDKIMFTIKNTGSIPLVKASFTWYVGIKDNDVFTNLKTSDEKYPNGHPMAPLAPNEDFVIGIPIEQIHHTEITLGEKCRFGLRILYHDTLDHEYYYKLEGRFKNSQVRLNDDSDMN